MRTNTGGMYKPDEARFVFNSGFYDNAVRTLRFRDVEYVKDIRHCHKNLEPRNQFELIKDIC